MCSVLLLFASCRCQGEQDISANEADSSNASMVEKLPCGGINVTSVYRTDGPLLYNITVGTLQSTVYVGQTFAVTVSTWFAGPSSMPLGKRLRSFFYQHSVNPLTAVSLGSGYKFFVTLYGELAIRIEHYMQKRAVSRQPG